MLQFFQNAYLHIAAFCLFYGIVFIKGLEGFGDGALAFGKFRFVDTKSPILDIPRFQHTGIDGDVWIDGYCHMPFYIYIEVKASVRY